MKTPDAAIIINGGAIVASKAGTTPVEPSALNILIKKYTAKHVNMPNPNLIPKL